MASRIVGIEIGNDTLKMVVVTGGKPGKMICVRLPDNMVHEGRISMPDAMSEFLTQVRKENRIPAGPCALVLPENAVVDHLFSMPIMSEQELMLNLPYEFRDYVGQDGAKYHYDYCVNGVSKSTIPGQPDQMEIYAAAVKREVIDSYYDMLKKSGFTLKIAVPEEMAWANIIRSFPNAEKEICIVDAGRAKTRVNIYRDGKYVMGKTIDIAGGTVDAAIANITKVDAHVARTYKETNMDNILANDAVVDVFNTLAVEVMKVVNFYGYDSQGSNLRDFYYCGGLSHADLVRSQIVKATDLTAHDISRLLGENNEICTECALAAGAAMQK